MCCEDCPEYGKCEEKDVLKDDCCPKCPEYYDCTGILEEREENSI